MFTVEIDLSDPGDEFRLGRVNKGLSVGYGFMSPLQPGIADAAQ
jgi:hypothetical protein